ncbi:hypothetical protein BAE44_0018929 [Dichanthelium oligosanthes]|uniref:DUF6598 domain-containing protein n=1 Tax=Dichanthelium oligosanthes TaxID=888268 RepID=A0A1E5V4G9_9POAL|nr:hypothetical protein BAE44_0018929 [Dichanthelium oligosanthes]
MEIEGSAATPSPGRGKKRPPSPSTPPSDDEDEWLVSDSGSEEGEDDEDQVTVSSAGDCFNGCQCRPMCLLQFVDIKIAGYRHVQPGSANIFGFVAARDEIKPLRNYVYRHEINDCEAISVKRKTGIARLSLTSPARVIFMDTRVLIEFELYVRTEALPEDEPKGDCLIQGCTEFTNMHKWLSFVEHRRLYGERCALDVKYIALTNAVEAQVEVKVLRLGAIAGGINMKLHAKTSGFDEVIRLFRGAAPEPGSMMTFVVAVDRHNKLDLYIEASSRDDSFVVKEEKKPMSYSWRQYSFRSGYHGTDEEVAELGEFAEVSVKVIWRSHIKAP